MTEGFRNMQDTPLLNRIGSLEDYKQLPQKDLEELAREIRLCLVLSLIHI